MKRTLITLVMAISLVSAAFGASADAELKAIEQQWLDAYMKSDAAFIKNLEADDYSIIESDGAVITKAQDVKATADKTFVLKSASMSDVKVPDAGRQLRCRHLRC